MVGPGSDATVLRLKGTAGGIALTGAGVITASKASVALDCKVNGAPTAKCLDYADLLADIYVPHPHGGHAIPIAERQIVTLREKNGQLESKLRELIQADIEKWRAIAAKAGVKPE